MKILIFLFLFILSFFVVNAHDDNTNHEEPEACSVDRPNCAAPDLVKDKRTLEVLKQIPTTFLKINYISKHLILPFFTYILLAFLVVGILITCLFFSKKNAKRIVISWIVLLVLLGLLYSVMQYYAQDPEGGVIVCKDPNHCEVSMHVHADLKVSMCGKEIIFPSERGDLSKVHTHKERNKLHWHDLEKIDPKTKEIVNTSKLTLHAFFEQMRERFTDTCLLERCNGDSCPGSKNPGKVSMMVNGVPNTKFEKYIWKDGDKMVVMFE